MSFKLEIACFNLESALIAEENGADRIELCANYKEGGIYPGESLLKEVLAKTSIPVYVMIRPRPGNFCYSKQEIEKMKEQIVFCKKNNCDGLVFGILNSDNTVHVAACQQLVELAEPLPCTFHRAFDEVHDQKTALQQIIGCGFKRILSSGSAANASLGKNKLRELIQLANKSIIIMPGGGIRSSNINELIQYTEAKEFHSAALTSNSEIANPEEIKKLKSNLH